MKRTIPIILTLLLTAGILTACKQAEPKSASDKVSIVATIFAPYDFAKEIAGDKADVTMLLPPASESHSFEPTPQDIIKIQNCDVFIYVGGESDAWVDGILESMDTGKIRIVTLMDCADVVEEEIVEGMQDEEETAYHTGAPEEPEYDEHVWTSPVNAMRMAGVIMDALCYADSGNSDTYRANRAAYVEKLEELDAAFREVADNAKRKTIVFGDRFPFRYLADEYGLEYFAAFPGCSTETEPSAQTIAFLIDKVNDENIPVVFHIELSNEKMANAISESTGAKALLLHSCHNVSKTDFQNGVSYLDLMYQNVESLREALN